MPICEPTIKVECDKCGDAEDYDLTMLAGGGWDDRNLRRNMERHKWKIDGDMTICEACQNDQP